MKKLKLGTERKNNPPYPKNFKQMGTERKNKPRAAEYYYWEHFGLLDDPKYVSESVCRKIKLYSDNGIIPSVNMIFTFETKSHPLSIETVERIIREYFL